MKTIGLRAIRNNSALLHQSALAGDTVIITNRNEPISISIPFDDKLLETGLKLDLAIQLFENKTITLSKAAKMAGISIEAFIEKLALFDIVAVDYPASELDDDLASLDD